MEDGEMSGTDFFDDDLVARREETPLSVGGGPAGMGEQEREEEGAEISSLAISRIARHKEQVAEQVRPFRRVVYITMFTSRNDNTIRISRIRTRSNPRRTDKHLYC